LKHINLKNEIQLNQQSYEKLIDEATNEISNFIEKANLEKLS
jgi:cell division protein ZapA